MSRRCLNCGTPTVPMSISQAIKQGLVRHGQWPSWQSELIGKCNSATRWGNSASYHRKAEENGEPPTKRANLGNPRHVKKRRSSGEGTSADHHQQSATHKSMDTESSVPHVPEEPETKKRRSKAEREVHIEVDEEFRSRFSSESSDGVSDQQAFTSWDVPGQEQNSGPATLLTVTRVRDKQGQQGDIPSYNSRAFHVRKDESANHAMDTEDTTATRSSPSTIRSLAREQRHNDNYPAERSAILYECPPSIYVFFEDENPNRWPNWDSVYETLSTRGPVSDNELET